MKSEFVKKTPKDAFEVLENISNDYNLNYNFLELCRGSE